MFKERISHKKNLIRRKRSDLAHAVVTMSGISNISLGTDLEGREYWAFPTWLFIIFII
jgi:hypothetical protein